MNSKKINKLTEKIISRISSSLKLLKIKNLRIFTNYENLKTFNLKNLRKIK